MRIYARLWPRRTWRQMLRDQRGVAAATVAVSLAALIGVTGLGVDTGMWYAIKRQNQSAADAAAISAAYEVLAGRTNVGTNLIPAANEAATQNGYAGSTPANACSGGGSWVCYPYSDSLVPSGVAVVLSQTQSSWFASVGLPNVTIANRAVAAVNTLDNPCMILLNPTASKELDIQGSASLTMPGCSIYADSTASDSIYAQGGNNAVLTADTIITAGQIATTGQPQMTLTNPAQIGAPQIADPYAGTLTHSVLTSGMPATCTAAPPQNHTTVVYNADATFCGGLTIKNETVDLQPPANGHLTIWVTDGDLSIQANGVLECSTCNPATGTGITIILTIKTGTQVGTVTGSSNPTVGNPPTAPNFNAPTSGPFIGLLIVQDSNGLPVGTTYTSSSSIFQGGVGAALDGLVYFPKSNITFQGNPSVSSSCLMVIANTLTLAGNASMAVSGCPTNGPAPPPTVKTVALVE